MGGLQRIIARFYKVMKPVSTVSNGIGMVTLAAMMFLTVSDVVLRKMNMSIIVLSLGSYELIQFMMAITISFGLAYCGIEKGHITVDILENRLSKRTRGMLSMVTGFLGLIIMGLITWQTCVHIINLRESGLLSTVLLIPVYPLVGLVAFGIALYTVVLLVHLLEFIQEGTGK